MESIEVNQLEIGIKYCDINNINNATILKFEGYDKNHQPTFTTVDNNKLYITGDDGLIKFAANSSPFYKYPEQQIDAL